MCPPPPGGPAPRTVALPQPRTLLQIEHSLPLLNHNLIRAMVLFVALASSRYRYHSVSAHVLGGWNMVCWASSLPMPCWLQAWRLHLLVA